MFSNSFVFYSVKILAELAGDILYFPIWWYSRGLFNFILSLKDFLVNQEKSLALLVWAENIFKPMYAQYDWQGMLISFFMRVVQIIFRSVAMLFWIALALAALIFWILLPALIIFEISFQFV